ncbi:hypothetical protein [Streptomyces sp. NPDC018045]|uniref:hypothetical protein n=1 Tax=Streptomyces sp. NPDC018045 TaxID=3365037 RepID=UPI0037926633
MGGEVHRGERAVADAQGDLVAVEDIEHVEDVPVPRTRQNISEVCTVSPDSPHRCEPPDRAGSLDALPPCRQTIV